MYVTTWRIVKLIFSDLRPWISSRWPRDLKAETESKPHWFGVATKVPDSQTAFVVWQPHNANNPYINVCRFDHEIGWCIVDFSSGAIRKDAGGYIGERGKVLRWLPVEYPEI